MIYQNDDIVEASVTKSRPGQKVGLGLEEHRAKGGDNDDYNRIYVTDIGGLFKKNGLPVHAGDELLEVNGIPVFDKEKFPNGLKDVKTFLRGEWSIRVKVGRNNDGCDTSTTTATTLTPQNSYSNLQPEDDSGHSRDAMVVANSEPNPDARDAPVTTKRRGRRKKKETLGTLIRDVRSRTPSGRGTGTRRGKRETNETTEEDSGARRGTRRGRREAREHEQDSNHSRSFSNKKEETRTTELNSGHDKKTSGKKKGRKETSEVDSGHRRSASDKKKGKKETSEPNSDHRRSASYKKIQGVQCTGSGITLEMNDGNRVSVNPEDLMALVSEENGKFVAISNRTLDAPPKLRRSKSDKPLPVPESDDDEGQNCSDDKPLDVPTLKDLRNLLKKKSAALEEDKPLDLKNTPTLPDLSNLLNNTPDDMSLANILKQNPWARTSLLSIVDECMEADSSRNLTTRHQSTINLSLKDLLGDRLKKTNPKKWEESSMVSSTLACMTNLIDPGDLMKIRNFAARPKLNGATVEIVRKSQGSYSNRWDVRVIQRKHQSPGDAANDSNRLISVAAENLKHFV